MTVAGFIECILCSRRTRTQPQRLSVTERVVRTANPAVAAPVAVLVPRHVPRRPRPGRSPLPIRAQPNHQPAVQRSAGAGRSSPGLAVHPGLPAGRRGWRRWRQRQPPVQDDHQRTGRGRGPGPVPPVPPWPAPSAPPVVRRLGIRNGDAGPVLVGRQHPAARAARPAVANQRRRSANVASSAAAAAAVAAVTCTATAASAATAAATVVRVAVTATTPSSPPPDGGYQSAVADQQRSKVHRENGQWAGFGVSRRRTTSRGHSQVNRASKTLPTCPPHSIIPTP